MNTIGSCLVEDVQWQCVENHLVPGGTYMSKVIRGVTATFWGMVTMLDCTKKHWIL